MVFNLLYLLKLFAATLIKFPDSYSKATVKKNSFKLLQIRHQLHSFFSLIAELVDSGVRYIQNLFR